MISTAARGLVLFLLALPVPASAQEAAVELGSPAGCKIGVECFVQQYPDMADGPDIADPLCGSATYDGHDGTDLRLLSLPDIQPSVPVLAMADGVVLRGRDGMPDRLVQTQEDRAAVAGRECGNGLVVDHEGGIEAQYCHLRQGSIAVAPGQSVGKGDIVGAIGASGLVQFPHVHVVVRRNDEVVDPLTGRALGEACAPQAVPDPLWEPEVAGVMSGADAQIVALGVTDGPVDHDSLTALGPPGTASADADAIVGWAWFLNLRGGDRVRVALTGPAAEPLAENASPPLERAKADYSAFAGRRITPQPGSYRVVAQIVRGGRVIAERGVDVEVR